jgi:predicted dehydrogenase
MLRVTLKGHQLTPPVRLGLTGTGHWARITHAPALASTDGIELAAVWAATLTPRRTSRPAMFLAGIDAVAFAVP